jgi:ubiquinone/menaquinone biosynthesis C-methylase UbiE
MKFSKFFSNIQEASWYRAFLNPVINEINEGTLLDIGTGSGKLIQIVATEKNMQCIGVDTNTEMLEEAKIKLKNTNAKLVKIEANKELPFNNNSFNYITICSVLFHLKKEQIDFMLQDARRLLKENGKIIILTPTGNGNILSLTKNFFSIKNYSINIWFFATKKRAKLWNENNYLKQYANEQNLNYKSQTVMKGFAQLEILNPKN